MIEDNFKKSLAEIFHFNSKEQLDQIIHERIERQLSNMYEQVKKDVSVDNMASNPFIIRGYNNRISKIINDLEVILTFSHDVIAEADHKVFRDLKKELTDKMLNRLTREQSIYTIIGFLSRYNGKIITPLTLSGSACFKIFK